MRPSFYVLFPCICYNELLDINPQLLLYICGKKTVNNSNDLMSRYYPSFLSSIIFFLCIYLVTASRLGHEMTRINKNDICIIRIIWNLRILVEFKVEYLALFSLLLSSNLYCV
jgi:hypothetical protein